LDLDSLQRSIERLERKIRPIARRPVEFGKDLRRKLAELPDPLDEAGIRQEAANALYATIDLYTQAGDDDRQAIRELFRTNDAFAWAAAFLFPSAPLRERLIYFSIVDQGSDPRDAVLSLAAICVPSSEVTEEAMAALRREVAAMSSNVDRYGFGSTRDLVLRGYGSYARFGAPQSMRD
jgi:hypothetical protein